MQVSFHCVGSCTDRSVYSSLIVLNISFLVACRRSVLQVVVMQDAGYCDSVPCV